MHRTGVREACPKAMSTVDTGVRDRRPRVAGALVVSVMLAAVVTAGPSWQNLGVFTATLLLTAMETTG